jgi:hypothetical protein
METHDRRLPALVAVPVIVLAMLCGLALSVLGFFGWLLGPSLLVLGVIGRWTGARWAPWALLVGGGLLVGTLAYVLVGLLTPDGPGPGPGSGDGTGGAA